MTSTFTPDDYSLWHGLVPMKRALERTPRDAVLVEGRGVRVRDEAGRWYIDARSGLWNLAFGYDERRIVEAMVEQLEQLPFATLLSYHRPSRVAVEYANLLAARLPPALRRLRFGHTGAQVVDAALTLSRFQRMLEDDESRSSVVALLGSYHGLGSGAGAVSGNFYFQHVYRSLQHDVHHAPLPEPGEGTVAESIEETVRELGAEHVTAVILEPVLGSNGRVVPEDELRRIAELCRGHGIHLILDEVSTGFGRVGALSRAVELGILPDMLLLGKGITGGYAPLAALAASEELYAGQFDPPAGYACPVGSTSDGHPVAMAAARAVLNVLDEDDVLANVARTGRLLRDGLESVRETTGLLREVRGLGLLLAAVPGDPDGGGWDWPRIDALRMALERRGLLVSAGLDCVLVVPPLVIGEEDCQEILEIVEAGVREMAAATAPAPA